MTVFGKRGDHLLAQRATILPDSPADVLWACDLCQIDMRAMAVHSQDPNYLSLFLPGLDPATGKPYDAHQGIADRLGITRKNAKVVGHGWNYGMELKRMIDDGIDPELARAFIRGMEQTFPRLVAWKAIPRCPTTIWLRGRADLVDRSGGVALNPVAMRRAPGHACSPHRSTDCAVHVQTTSRLPPGGGCRRRRASR
jgi:hypothetical protein